MTTETQKLQAESTEIRDTLANLENYQENSTDNDDLDLDSLELFDVII